VVGRLLFLLRGLVGLQDRAASNSSSSLSSKKPVTRSKKHRGHLNQLGNPRKKEKYHRHSAVISKIWEAERKKTLVYVANIKQ